MNPDAQPAHHPGAWQLNTVDNPFFKQNCRVEVEDLQMKRRILHCPSQNTGMMNVVRRWRKL